MNIEATPDAEVHIILEVTLLSQSLIMFWFIEKIHLEMRIKNQ